jgi:porin
MKLWKPRCGLCARSKRAQQLDLDFQRLVLPSWPVRSFDGLVTAVYQYQIRDGWPAQPNFQYIIHPGGGATLPLGPQAGTHLKNAQFSA